MSMLPVLLLSAFCLALVATFYFQSTKPDGFLATWSRFLHRCYEEWAFKEPPICNGANRHERYSWILKPILTCERCIGGQFGFWGYLYWFGFSLSHSVAYLILVTAATSVFTAILYRLQS